DDLRQNIENIAVNRQLDWMRGQGKLKQDVIGSIDFLADPILYDLKVLHNASQRAKGHASLRASSAPAPSSPPGSPPKRSRSKDVHGRTIPRVQKTAIDRVKDICGYLDSDTKMHCNRMRVPHKAVQDVKNQKMLHMIQNCTPQATRQSIVAYVPKRFDSSFGIELKNLFGLAAMVPGGDHPLTRLANFIHDQTGCIKSTLQAFDCHGQGGLLQEDFCTGLELMAYPYGDPKTVFAMLDDHGVGELDINVLEEKLLAHLDEETLPEHQ
ncbi:unnamed protein product, partial [Polarella glacialis]